MGRKVKGQGAKGSDGKAIASPRRSRDKNKFKSKIKNKKIILSLLSRIIFKRTNLLATYKDDEKYDSWGWPMVSGFKLWLLV